jgi:WD40 repeat protein
MSMRWSTPAACLALALLAGNLWAVGKAGAPTVTSPDRSRIITADGATITCYDAKSQKVIFVTRGHVGAVNALAFAPDGKTFASGGKDQTVRLWDVATGKALRIFKGHTAAVTSLTYAANGKTMTSTATDKTTCVWEPATGKLLKKFKKK